MCCGDVTSGQLVSVHGRARIAEEEQVGEQLL